MTLRAVYLVAAMGLEEAPHPGLAEVGRPELVVLAVDAGVGQDVAVVPGNTLRESHYGTQH